ncbi:MAG: RNA polymerase subunit sigma-24 [Chlorobi bacterium]|nr:RNA polymerase subunit sigma-24 [Chlorobiota bacterium]
MDLLNELYSLGYWMTGSLKKTNELVLRTYRSIQSDTPEIEVFRIFREVYYEHADRINSTSKPTHCNYPDEELLESLRQQETDKKLTVLLSEICGMNHRAISIIIGKPLNTIRTWLSSGRKSIAEGLLVIVSCCQTIMLA